MKFSFINLQVTPMCPKWRRGSLLMKNLYASPSRVISSMCSSSHSVHQAASCSKKDINQARSIHSLQYHHPYRLSLIQRAFLFPYLGASILLDPRKGHVLAALGDMTSESRLNHIKNNLMESEAGQRLLAERPLISSSLLQELASPTTNPDSTSSPSFPPGSLGEAYSSFMKSHGFSADDRAKVVFLNDESLAYILVRYRQVHDFWHVLVGLQPTVLGEVALKWFEFKVTGLPIAALGGSLGPLKLSPSEHVMLAKTYLPWAFRTTCSCSTLLSFRYEDHLHENIDVVRQCLNIEPAPTS